MDVGPAVMLHRAEADRERQMFVRLNDVDDPLDADVVLARYLPLARRIAGSCRVSGEPFEDLVQVACVGLLKAIRRYEVGRGSRFSSFATPVIRGELLRYLRDATWVVRVGRDQQCRALRVERCAWELAARLGRSPTVQELADAVDCTLEDVVDARLALLAHRPGSLHGPARGATDGETMVIETLGAEDGALEAVLDRDRVEGLLGRLPRRDREILRLRYQQGLTQREIGHRVGLSQMQVSRVLKDAQGRLEAVREEAVW